MYCRVDVCREKGFRNRYCVRMDIKACNMGSGGDQRFTLVVAAAAQRERVQSGGGSVLCVGG